MSSASRNILIREACSPRCRAGRPEAGFAPSKARCPCSVRCRQDARFIRGVLIASTPARELRRTTTRPAPATPPSVISMPLVEVVNLVKHFVRNAGFLRKGTLVKAVDGISFSIEPGETFGLVGESGSGKTTAGRCLLRLIEPTSGAVRFRGEDVLAFSRSRLREARRGMQIVFQDPYSSLNPRMRARKIVEEPLVIHELG